MEPPGVWESAVNSVSLIFMLKSYSENSLRTNDKINHKECYIKTTLIVEGYEMFLTDHFFQAAKL